MRGPSNGEEIIGLLAGKYALGTLPRWSHKRFCPSGCGAERARDIDKQKGDGHFTPSPSALSPGLSG